MPRKEKSTPSEDDNKLRELDDLVKDLSEMKEQTVSKRPKKESGKSRRTRRKTLLQRIANATEKNKVIDVTNWREGEGYTEVRVISKPPPGTAKVCIEGLALASSNEATYARALEELGDDYQHFLAEYQVAALAVKDAPPVARKPRNEHHLNAPRSETYNGRSSKRRERS